jgi:hypothetical protein
LEEENRAFRDDTLDPWLCQFELEYQKLLTEDQQWTQSHDVEAVRESLTRTNMKDRADILYKNVGGPIMTQNEGREISGLPKIDGGDELLKPANMTPPAAGADSSPAPESDPADTSETEQDRAAFDAHCRAALADVAARMLKRLNTQIERTKADGWSEFVSSLEEKHGEVIRSAFAPLVPLCQGDTKSLDSVSRSFFELTSRGANHGVPITTTPDTLAAQILSIIRSRT